ncbi:MAG TPA: glutamate racemase [Oscillospiraceae bacterium]|nr:glutamate racemase [Oscillospiraceae bacterium]
MDNRPIGVFDSGLGGLTALRELRKLLPEEQLVYFGDTGRVPYGGRSPEIILRYARQDVKFLSGFDLKAIMIACGTVCTTSMDILAAESQLPLFGVVEPAAQAAARATKNGKIGLIGTAATIRSGAFQRLLGRVAPAAEVFAAACPLFVPLVECGRVEPGDVVIETVTAEYLAPIRAAGVDTLVLGCTHYPLLERVIGNFIGPDVALVSTGAVGARRVAEELRAGNLLAAPGGAGACRYYVSDSTDDFARLAGLFMGAPVTGAVERVSLE